MQKKHILMLICLLFQFGFTNSQVIVVNQNGGGDYEHIQDGINASYHGDTVLVYPGIYYENINFTGKNITLASLYLITQDESYIDETVIDGNQQGSVVLFISGEDSTAMLCGFTIRNGNGTILHGKDKQGGGIALKDSKVTIKKCIIKNNHVSDAGGGIYVRNSILHISGSKVKENYAFRWGGGIMLASDSQIFFDTLQLNDIYLNYSRSGCDFLKTPNCPNVIEFVVDTFTVLNPDHFYISSPDPNWYQLNDILISIQHAKVETVNGDLYVNPEGNNSNSGLTFDEPLQSLSYALTKIVSDSLHPNTIYLSNGIYSPSTTNEYFPLRCRSFVSFEGESMVNTILDAEYTGYHFHGYRYANEIAFTNLSLIRGNGNISEWIGLMGSFWLYGDSAVSFQNVIISDCIGASAGAMAIGTSDNIRMQNVFFDNNEGAIALFMYDSRPKYTQFVFENLTVKENHGSEIPDEGWGGGVGVLGSRSKPDYFTCTFVNTEIIENHCTFPYSNPAGMGLSVVDGANVVLVNSTIGDNTSISTAINCAAVSIGTAARLKIYNSIVYNPALPWEVVIGTSLQGLSTMSLYYSLLRGGDEWIYTGGGHEIIWGDGILDSDPFWVGTGEYPYSLSDVSPCINAGTPMFEAGMEPPYIKEEEDGYYLYTTEGDTIHIPSTDLAGNPRISGNRIDMGAYEFQDGVFAPVLQPQAKDLTLLVYPNPFPDKTTISFTSNRSCQVTLEIFTLQGLKIKTLMESLIPPGAFSLYWDGTTSGGNKAPKGTYICRLMVDGEVSSKVKMVKMR